MYGRAVNPPSVIVYKPATKLKMAEWRQLSIIDAWSLPMLPTGHIEWTWAGLNLLQRATGRFADADYRKAAAVVLLPDLIDKPLALFLFPNANAALFFGHTLLLHGLVWAFAWATGRLQRWLVYLLAFSGHLLQDRMWGFTQTLLWPLRGLSWHPWQHVGTAQEMVGAYLEVLQSEPILLILDGLGLLLLAWFLYDRRLTTWPRLRAFFRTGRAPDDVQTPTPATQVETCG